MIRILYYWDGRWFSTGHVDNYYVSDASIIAQIKSDIRRNMAWWTDANQHLTWRIYSGWQDVTENYPIDMEA